jgi:hypothetical protein
VNNMLKHLNILSFFEKRKLVRDLEDCNFQLAGEVLYKKYGESSSINAFGHMLAEYMEDPCLERAMELIESNSALTIYFVECKPNGYYSRRASKLTPEYTDHVGMAPVAAAAEAYSEQDEVMTINQFPNVLPTMRNYIEDLQQEIERIHKDMDIHMNMTETKRAQLEQWVAVCEQGIEEFEAAIKVLNRHSRKQAGR